MPYAKIEPSGCCERHGNVQARLDMFLEPDDARYDERYILVPIIPSEGYTGRVDKEDNPEDQEEYNAWLASLPHIYQLNPFHSHFVYFDPYTLRDEDIEAAINRHLPNFYKAWIDEWDKVNGGMRHGWDIETRQPRPPRYNKLQPEIYPQRRLDCLAKVDILKTSSFTVRSAGIGECDFPATAIDIGPAAIERSSYSSSATRIAEGNPANDTGWITSVEIWAYSNMLNTEVATFEEVSGDTFTTRDSEALGTVTSGSKQTFSGLDMDVATGDYLGAYWTDGRIEKDNSGSGYWYVEGADHIPCTSQAFSHTLTDRDMSLYGTGDTVAETQTITPSGIATVEALGSHQVNLEIAPSGLASVEALGSPQLNLKLEPSGIATLEGIGSHSVLAGIRPDGIATVEALGSPVVAGPIITSGIASLEGLGSPQLNLKIEPKGFLLGGWKKRIKLTIDHNDIDEALTNFPILIHLSTSSGIGSDDVSCVFDELGNDANRKKIAITTDDEVTECYVEIEKWDDANEEAWLWVKVPSIVSGADTELYFYYDKDHADNDSYVGDTNSTPAENVWGSEYKVVLHLHETSGTHYDSTDNSTDGTPALTIDQDAIGQIAGCDDFDGAGYVNLGSTGVLDFTEGEITISFWANPDAKANQYFNIHGSYGVSNTYYTYLDYAGRIYFRFVRDGVTTQAYSVVDGYVAGELHRYTLTRIGNTGYIYRDGTDITDHSDTLNYPKTDDTWNLLGRWPGTSNYAGLIDEYRIAFTGRTLAWVKASDQSERDDLIGFGSEEEGIGIRTVEALGSPQVNLILLPSGITSLEGLGSPQLDLTIFPDGLASVEGLGEPTMELYLKPGGIATVEGMGTPKLNFTLTPSGIASVEGLGQPQFNFTIEPSGIATVEALGQPISIVIAPAGGGLGYVIELRDSSGNLLAILENAHSITLMEELNRPPALDFKVPADESKLTDLSTDNEIWLRNYESGTLIKKFLLSRRRDIRQ